jgi:hypothetical protein
MNQHVAHVEEGYTGVCDFVLKASGVNRNRKRQNKNKIKQKKNVPASVTLMLLASGVNKLRAIADAQESPDNTWFGVVV